jgi:Asp/Glu/hydantoin racemase
MPIQILLVHTVPPLIQVFNQLGRRFLPEAHLLHVLDEPALVWARKQNTLDSAIIARLQEHIHWAEKIGTHAVLVTCSTISPAVDSIKANIPVYKIDHAMMARAVRAGGTIGVLATAQSTLEPTRHSLEAEAQRQGRKINTQMTLVDGAFEAFLAGDWLTHDQLLWEAIERIEADVDLIMLAQASMAHVLTGHLVTDTSVPILTSPQAALEQIRADLVR